MEKRVNENVNSGVSQGIADGETDVREAGAANQMNNQPGDIHQSYSTLSLSRQNSISRDHVDLNAPVTKVDVEDEVPMESEDSDKEDEVPMESGDSEMKDEVPDYTRCFPDQNGSGTGSHEDSHRVASVDSSATGAFEEFSTSAWREEKPTFQFHTSIPHHSKPHLYHQRVKKDFKIKPPMKHSEKYQSSKKQEVPSFVAMSDQTTEKEGNMSVRPTDGSVRVDISYHTTPLPEATKTTFRSRIAAQVKRIRDSRWTTPILLSAGFITTTSGLMYLMSNPWLLDIVEEYKDEVELAFECIGYGSAFVKKLLKMLAVIKKRM